MIISASYKTDIPTFYGDWFMKRLNAGYCKMINPYNRKPIRVSLAREYVDGFVFWTKNISPFARNLSEIKNKGYPFVVQHTINGYPRELESHVVDHETSIENALRIRKHFGPRVFVWRYDTILITSLTDKEFHLKNFANIAKKLYGTTDEVVISFATLYSKTVRNLNLKAKKEFFTWRDPEPEEKLELSRRLTKIANSYDMQLSVCSQRDYLVPGAKDARCIDAQRLSDVAGTAFSSKTKGNREQCGCFESRDIGDYDTCPHGCVYCYAVRNQELAKSRFKNHDPDSEFLFQPEIVTNTIDTSRETIPLFED